VSALTVGVGMTSSSSGCIKSASTSGGVASYRVFASSSSGFHPGGSSAAALPRGIVVPMEPVADADEQLMRVYVSKLWAEDWDCDDDDVYDSW
jgi:hypothetical protein